MDPSQRDHSFKGVTVVVWEMYKYNTCVICTGLTVYTFSTAFSTCILSCSQAVDQYFVYANVN